MFAWGLYFGFMGAMMLYHLFVYLAIGNRNYFAYAVMVLAAAVHSFTGSAWLPPDLPEGLPYASASAVLITISLLARLITNPKPGTLESDRIYLLIAAGAALLVPAGLWMPDFERTWVSYAALYGLLVMNTLSASIAAVRKGERQTMYLLVGVVLYTLSAVAGYLEIGSLLLVFMLAFSLSGSMHSFRRYTIKEKHKRLMLEHLQEYTRNMAATLHTDTIRDIAVTGLKELAGSKKGTFIALESNEAFGAGSPLPLELMGQGSRALQKSVLLHGIDAGILGNPGGKEDCIAVPVICQNRMLAVVLLSCDGKKRIPPDTFAMLDELAAQTAVALENARLFYDTQLQAETDGLTGLFNRTTFFEKAEEALEKAMPEGIPFAVIMVDADHFKQINDNYGHDIGDQILQRLAKLLRNNFKGQDIIGRYGGEEFIIALPQTDLHEAKLLGERLRKAIESGGVSGLSAAIPEFTISVGVSAVHPSRRETLADVVQRADQALYAAKRGGRNRVESEARRERIAR